MSHSKYTKRGFSYIIEKSYSSEKKYINICGICGHKGYSPVILEEGFLDKTGKSFVVRRELIKILNPLSLDNLGRCEICAKIHDKEST